MTTFERFERSIPELMTELAPTRVPDYFDDMLRTTARHGQRPAWSFLERWLPVEITARPLSMRSFSWRPVLILALVVALVVAGLAVYVGSRNRVPPPFGPAGNGVLLYRAADGSVVSLDPVNGATSTLVPASDNEVDPVPSRDGRRMALVTFGSTSSLPIIIRGVDDGANQVTLAGQYREIDAVEWSPDGSHVAIVSNQGGLQSITVASTDGASASTLPLGRQVSLITYLPDGRLVTAAAERPGDECPGEDPTRSPCALFVVNSDGTGLDTLISAADFHGINTLSPSPEGTKLLWVQWNNEVVPQAPGRLHIFDLVNHVDHTVPDEVFPSVYAMNRAWFSPDGSSILFDFFEADGDHWGIVPASGGTPIRIGQKWPPKGSDGSWAPDGRFVLARFAMSDTSSELWLIDPSGSVADRRLAGDLPYLPPWQRIAP
jgi:WD40 repeat protein